MQSNPHKIFADFRENRSKVPKFLMELGMEVKGADLSADYLINQDCQVEQKTIANFITSIADGRLFRQVNFLAYHCKNPLLILEGGGLYKNGRVPPNNIRGTMLWVSVTKKVPIMRTYNQYDTACTLGFDLAL